MADAEVEQSELSAIIAEEIRNSQTYDQTEISGKRALAIAYMRGEVPDLTVRPNGSSQTSRDVPDTISWILPGIIRVFTASDQMVQYDQVREEDDQWAREATEYTNYTFFRESNGYRILYNATYDSLLMGNGVACSYWEQAETETKTFTDKLPEELAQLMMEEDWTPIAQKSGKPRDVEIDDPATGKTQTVGLPTFTVKMQRTTRKGRICDTTCKPENLLLNSLATTIEDARFVAYLHDDKTRSDLMEMAGDYGWDKEQIEGLNPNQLPLSNEVSDARFSDVATFQNSPVKSGDPIDLYECYLKADTDGDGIAELLQVWYAGNAGSGIVLGWEEWDDDVPFTDIPCYPVPHRFDAESVADRVMDVARIKTILLRQTIDNMYASQMPMQEVDVGSVLNPDILVNPKFGGLIWKKAGSAPIQLHEVPFTADKTFPAIEYFDQVIAKRTGVSKTTMALDPETLQNQSATGTQLQHDAGYSQIELIARNMAELGWARFFQKRLKLAIKYEQVRAIPSAQGAPGPDGKPGKFASITPGKWDPNMAVTINVGLGTGSRDRDMQMLNTIMTGQVNMANRLAEGGFDAKAIEFIPKIRMTAVRMAEASGIRNPDEYYPPITDADLAAMQQQATQPPPPDPKLQIEQLRTQTQLTIQQSEQQSNAARAQAEIAKAQSDAQVKIVEAQAKSKEAEMQVQLSALQIQLQHLQAAAKNVTAENIAAMDNLVKLAVADIMAKNADPAVAATESKLEGDAGVSTTGAA